MKLEAENNEYERARGLLANARVKADTEKVWMKSVVLERQLGQIGAAVSMLGEALELCDRRDACPTFFKPCQVAKGLRRRPCGNNC